MPDQPEPHPQVAPRKADLTDAWDRAAHVMVPRFMFPLLAGFFVLLCGTMAVMLYGVGSYFGGALFSLVVLVGLYVLWNNVRERLAR
jgi:hypothetical protein